jgi:RNA polymerase sigma factor (TIGR02999 family)
LVNHEWQRPNPEATAAEELLPLVYDELRSLAAAKMFQEQPGQTLQATALVHEAWLRLTGSNPVQWNSRGHFFGAAAEAMRRILLERARKKGRVRHGGAWQRVDLDQVTVATQDAEDVVVAVHEALEKLAVESPQKAEIVKLRYFGLGSISATHQKDLWAPLHRSRWARHCRREVGGA